MEVRLIMDPGTDGLGATMWLTGSLTPTYNQQSSPDQQNDCEPIVGRQVSLGHTSAQNLPWQDKQLSPKSSPEPQQQNQYHHQLNNNQQQQHLHQLHQQQQQQYPDSPLSTTSQSSEHKLNFGTTSLHSPSSSSSSSQALKRSANDNDSHHQQNSGEPGRKIVRKNENGSPSWPSQVEVLAEHLVNDFDGPLSVLAASDLATAVASYNMSEALLALPSLTVFKQEALSPENQHNNKNNNSNNNTNTASLNHNASQRNIDGAPPSNGNTNLAEADSNNNAQNSANLHHQLLYSSNNSANDEYQPNSGSGNHVSSSQQSSDFNEECRFQYTLISATSIATKVNEETITYLNQGQPYEIKLKKLNALSAYCNQMLESTIRICFHERRFQYMEREQIQWWQNGRPGERMIEVDVPLSFNVINVNQSSSLTSVDFTWNSARDSCCYIKVNCISTEFAPKRHGGERGVPLRIQVETRLPGGSRLHAASCQIKVFKLKGAERKHKQDRDKINRLPPHELDKYQPKYEYTLLTDVPLDSLSTANSINQNVESPYSTTDVISPLSRVSSSPSPVASSLALSSGSNLEDVIPTPAQSSTPTAQLQQQQPSSQLSKLSVDANESQTNAWLRAQGFHAFEATFDNFSAVRMLRLSRSELIEICGLADGIDLFNALRGREPLPLLTLYFALKAPNPIWRVLNFNNMTLGEFTSKLLGIVGLPRDRLHSIFMLEQGIQILVDNEAIAGFEDKCKYFVETINEAGTDRYKLLLKRVF